MPVIDIRRPAKIVNGLVQQTYQFYNEETNSLEFRTQLIEDSEERSISNSIEIVQSGGSANLFIENISNQLASGKIDYTISNTYNRRSLSVYYNGLNVSSDITEVRTNGSYNSFTFKTEYASFISENDIIIISYSKGSTESESQESESSNQGSSLSKSDFSVSNLAAGASSLAYDSSSGTFSYIPPDLSGYITGISGLNISELTNDSGYITGISGLNISELTNDSGLITLTDISISTQAAGESGLSYNNSNGVLSFTPPDLSSYITGISGLNISDLTNDSGFITGISGLNISELTNDSGYITAISGLNISDLTNDSGFIDLTDISVSLQPAGISNLSYNSLSGVLAFTPPDLSSYITGISGLNISDLTNDSGYITGVSGLNISDLTNDSGYITEISGLNISDLTNDSGYITEISGLNISNLTNDSGYITGISGLNISDLTNDSGYIDLTDISVSTQPVGDSALSYNNVNGVLTFTPPDLSSFLTSSGLTENRIAFANSSGGLQDSANLTFDGSSLDLSGSLKISSGVYESFSEKSGESTHDCSNGHIFYHDGLSSNFSVNLTNLDMDIGIAANITLVIDQGSSAYKPSSISVNGGSSLTINWEGGSSPSGNSNKIDVFSFSILRNSSTYIVLGQMVSFG